MNYFLGTLALLGLGFIGLLMETHKQDKKLIKILRKSVNDEHEACLEFIDLYNLAQEKVSRESKLNDSLLIQNFKLKANQKVAPWNKGKKGYKITRKPKEVKLVDPIQESANGGYTSESTL
jgi:hypothetical protein